MTLAQLARRPLLLALAGALGGALTVLAPQVHAAPPAGFYRAELAQPAARPRAIVRDVLFACSGDSCQGPRAASRADYVCVDLARAVGPLKSFTAGEERFDQARLAACNARS